MPRQSTSVQCHDFCYLYSPMRKFDYFQLLQLMIEPNYSKIDPKSEQDFNI